MKISLNWLSDYINLNALAAGSLLEKAESIAARLTQAGLEVEGIEEVERIKGGLKGVVIGQVMTCAKHPNADKLSVTTIDVGGSEVLPIVCGAPNVAAGQKVLVAQEGALLYPTEGEPFTIKKSKIRGEVSQGMICAEDELGLGHSHDGILVLDTDLPNGTPAAQYFNLEADVVLEIGLTANRSDAGSHYGVARDLRALYNQPLKKPSVADFKTVSNKSVSVEIQDSIGCPRYAAVRVEGINVGTSPEWLKQRLAAIGVNSINNVVDITNYILHGLGQPLHAFDADVIGDRIIVRRAQEDETLVTLDGTERKLSTDNLIIADSSKPIAIAGVFGGLESGVTEKTQNVIIESAYFDPAVVRKSAQVHGIKTDASYLFERGTDPEAPAYAAMVAALMLVELAGGTIASDVVDNYVASVQPAVFKVNYEKLFGLIGVRLETDQVKQILNNLDISLEEDSQYGHMGFADSFTATVPAYRVDVNRPADIAEEVLRIYGLDNVPLKPHASSNFLAPQPVNDNDKLQYRTAAQLAAMGWQETINNSLTSPAYAALTATQGDEANVLMLNPLSEELSAMRQSLVFNGLQTLAYNINRQQRNLKTFEFGKIYRLRDAENADVLKRFDERWQLGLWLTGQTVPETWQTAEKDAQFFDLRSAVQAVLLKMVNQQIVPTVTTEDDRFAYAQQWVLNKQVVAVAGLISPKFTKHFGIKQQVFYAEVDWQYLLKKYKTGHTVTEVPKYPAVRRDLSLVLDKQVTFEQVRNTAFKTERKLLKDINVFSVYEGPNLGEGKKSYAVSFTLQSSEATLNDQQIESTMTRLMDAFTKDLGAVIRQ